MSLIIPVVGLSHFVGKSSTKGALCLTAYFPTKRIASIGSAGAENQNNNGNLMEYNYKRCMRSSRLHGNGTYGSHNTNQLPPLALTVHRRRRRRPLTGVTHSFEIVVWLICAATGGVLRLHEKSLHSPIVVKPDVPSLFTKALAGLHCI